MTLLSSSSRLLVATLGTTLAASPPLLVGGLALFMQADLDFGAAQLGFSVGAFFVAAALASIPAGLITGARGPLAAIALGATVTTVCLVSLAALAGSWLHLVALLSVCGAASAVAQVGANHLIAVHVARSRQGIAFGFKQAAIPLAAVFSGFAVPLGYLVGWRAALVCFALLSAALLAFSRKLSYAGGPSPRDLTSHRARDAGMPRLLERPFYLIALGGAIASAAGNAPVVFLVHSLVAQGVAAEAAGLLLAIGSFSGLAVRVVGGWVADRITFAALRLVAVLLCAGAVGNLLLAAWGSVPVVVAVVLLFGGGWGWPGLYWLGVARETKNSAPKAFGVAQAGTFAGAVVGPVAFGVFAETASVRGAWVMVAGGALIAAACMVAGQRSMLRRSVVVTVRSA